MWYLNPSAQKQIFKHLSFLFGKLKNKSLCSSFLWNMQGFIYLFIFTCSLSALGCSPENLSWVTAVLCTQVNISLPDLSAFLPWPLETTILLLTSMSSHWWKFYTSWTILLLCLEPRKPWIYGCVGKPSYGMQAGSALLAFLWVPYFTLHRIFKVHPWGSLCQTYVLPARAPHPIHVLWMDSRWMPRLFLFLLWTMLLWTWVWFLRLCFWIFIQRENSRII